MRQRIYGVLWAMNASERNVMMHIFRKHPDTKWKHVWLNAHKACITDAQKSMWYVVIHELPPTNERLAAINLTGTNQCTLCSDIDTLQHRITQCGEGRVIRTCTRARITAFTCTNPQYIAEE